MLLLLRVEKFLAYEAHWVAPPRQTTGLDHLGVRAVSEAYYAELVPCVTNVTDRIRSYGFYAWSIWSFHERYPDSTYDQLVETFRKAECLMTLIGAAHEQTLGEEPAIHGEGLPGRFVLLKALKRHVDDGEALVLSKYAEGSEGNPDRYFKADLGGLRQYYLGTLQELNILGRAQDAAGRIAISPGRGIKLAQVYDAHVPGDAFWRVVDSDEVDLETLQELHRFCPCHLKDNEPERTVLLDYLLNRDDTDSPQMTDVVTMLLDSLAWLEGELPSRGEVVQDFRWRAFAGLDLEARPWNRSAVGSWRAYQQHEILGLAVQALFWIVYDCFENERPVAFSSGELSRWFLTHNRDDFSTGFLSQPFGEFQSAVAEAMPSPEDWENSEHERALCETLLTDSDDSYASLTETVARLLCTLIGRLPPERLYPGLNRDDSYFEVYPINLRQLRRLSEEEWQNLTVSEWLHWLIVHWGVGQQHRVALRKLRNSSEDTFRLLPTEHGLLPQGNVEVTFSNPRLNEALRALQDLGLVDETMNLTEDGQKLKEQLNV